MFSYPHILYLRTEPY